MIESLLQTIESKLYRAEFGPPPTDRLTACLAVHSALMGRTDCPRILLDSAGGGLKQFSEAVRSLLLTPLADVDSDTASSLTHTGLASLPLVDLSPFDRSRCLELVEDILHDGWQCRAVHYEMARTTPFMIEDLSRLLNRFNLRGAGAEARFTEAKLRERAAGRDAYAIRFPSLAERGNHQHRWDPLRLVEARKVDAEWQKLWAPPSAYTELPHEQRILAGLGKTWGKKA